MCSYGQLVDDRDASRVTDVDTDGLLPSVCEVKFRVDHLTGEKILVGLLSGFIFRKNTEH